MTPDPGGHPADPSELPDRSDAPGSSDPSARSVAASAGATRSDHEPDSAAPRGAPAGGARYAAASPTVRRRVLASELKALRKAAGLTHVDIANRLGWQQGKVSKIESAKQGIAIEAVIALAEICHVPPDRRDHLVGLARAARAKGWWESYGDVLTTEQRTYVGLETDADLLTAFAVEAVPELLRTREYLEATVRARAPTRDEQQVERAVEVVLERQRSLFEHRRLNLDVVLSESGLRRIVGSREVVLDQCDRLIDSATREDVVLRVLPFTAGPLPAGASFSILDFQRDPHPSVVFVPGEDACVHLENAAEVESYRETMSVLRSLALDPDASVACLRDLRHQLEGTVPGTA